MTTELDQDLSQSEAIFQFLAPHKDEIDRLFTYDEIEAGAGIDIRENRSAFETARKWFSKRFGLNLLNERGQGYRIAHPREAEATARQHVGSSKRKIRRGQRIAIEADRSLLTLEESKRLDHLDQSMAALRAAMARLEKRQERTERLVNDVGSRVKTLEESPKLTREEIAAFRAMLRQGSA